VPLRLRALCEIGLLVLLLGVAGCSSTPTTYDIKAEAEIAHGYALLTDLSGQNKNVGLILIIKGTTDPTEQLVQRIGKRYGELHGWLNEQGLSSPDTGLPAVETAARNGIAGTTRNQLLSKSGMAFEVHLLTTQEKSTAYAAALCRQLAGRLPKGEHRETLQDATEDFDALNQEVLTRLTQLTKPQ